jgi:archaellum component FlaC
MENEKDGKNELVTKGVLEEQHFVTEKYLDETLNKRFNEFEDKIDKKFDKKFDDFEKRLDKKFDLFINAVNTRFENLENRVDKLSKDLYEFKDQTYKNFDWIITKMQVFEYKLDVMTGKYSVHDERINNHEHRLQVLERNK